MRDMGVVHGALDACLRDIVVNGKEAARAFPMKREKLQAHCSFTPCAFSNLVTAAPFFLLKLLPLLAAAAPSLPLILHPL